MPHLQRLISLLFRDGQFLKSGVFGEREKVDGLGTKVSIAVPTVRERLERD